MESAHVRKDDKVFEIINNVLQGVFGDEATRLIYEHLERRYSLKQTEISDNIEVFTKGLEEFLDGAAYPIENKILNDLLAICGLNDGVSLQIAVPEEIATPNA